MWSQLSPPDASAERFGLVQASHRWPSSTVGDWAGYADQLSVVSVVADRELPPPRVGTTGGYVGRAVTVEVGETSWRRAGAPIAPDRFEMNVYGWLETDGARRLAVTDGGVWLRVGERYLLPLVRSDEGDWTGLSTEAPVTLAGRTATSHVDVGAPSAALRSLKGRTVDAAGDVLRRTPIPAGVGKHADLPPEARFQAAEREIP
jgi:hypothetical protein